MLYFSIEISAEILTWIIRTLNFSTENSDIQSSRVIVVRFSILNINVEITILSFSTEISDIEPSHVLVMLFLSTQIDTEILTWIIAIVKFIPKLVI